MQQHDIEAVYEELAQAIDAAGEEQSELFLARLCLLMAREIGDRDRALALIGEALGCD